MNINSPLLRKFITLGRIDADMVKEKQQEFTSTAELISKCGKIDSKDLAAQCIDLFRVPYFDLKDFDPAKIPAELVKEKLIRKHHILPLVKKDRKVYIAASDPTDYGAFENFEFSTGLSCEIVVVDYIQLNNKIEQLLDAAGSLNLSDDEFKEFADLDTEGVKDSAPKDDEKEDAPIIVYINKILIDAIKKGA
jgi:type IV pilus assembly protein PilB